jgi:general nucleoside transport system permease protein
MRLEPRDLQGKSAAAPLLWAFGGALLFTLAVCSLLVLWAGAPVLQSFSALFAGGFGSVFALTETLTRATPLILTGLAAAVAFKARLWNIGAEGQLYAGALAAVAVGGLHGGEGFAAPDALLFTGMIAAAMLAGAALLAVPALLKTYAKVDEVVTTLLLNFVVLLAVSWMLDGPMKDPTAMGWPQTVALKPELELSKIVDQSRLHSGFAAALLIAGSSWLALRYTTFGFALRAVGANARASRFLGLPVTRTVLLTAVLSGALAGLAGAIEVAGRTGYVTLDMSPGYGYSGIVIAMLAALNPLAVVPAAILVAGVLVGADTMSRVVAVPTFIADVMVAVSLIAVLVATMLTQYRVRFK